MSHPLVTVQPVLAQQQPQPTPTPTPTPTDNNAGSGSLLWMILTLLFFLSSVGLVIYGKALIEKQEKATKLDQYKIRDLKKKLKLALTTIKKMETNPDLVHSRDFNLDYLRMRMEEGMFNSAIVNQMEIKVKQLIRVALRPSTADVATVGVAATGGRQVDEMFDVHYETDDGQGKRAKGVLFRVHIKLTKLPTQSSSNTVEQIITCLKTFLNPLEAQEHWQPSVQGRIAVLEWDQKAKPTPLLVLRQSEEGGNVSFRTQTARPPRPRTSGQAATQQRRRPQGGTRSGRGANGSSAQQQQRRRSSSASQHQKRRSPRKP
ncbi:hypothetical protein [[Limnothrix rosea] IAM M-220]|uniref:hypothetical protein n=1 Tax=[Limnothrix rosea] IAM M-220 TaxID=454133 RepID=UPI00095AB3A4|nr:hypothetical protein [[Limnothrix rosea] IAM M-220]OKH16917.1 hypothetical protein NIES208_11520 [[Limnothrix rosea] IAM M-220]